MILNKDINWYIKNRNEQLICAQQIRDIINNNINIIAVCAPVKSGKKDIAIIVKLLGVTGKKDNEIHCFFTSLNRNDCKTQLEEYKDHGFDVCAVLARNDNLEKAINDVKQLLEMKQSKIIIHLDESDYGTANKSILEKFYKEFKNNKNIIFVCYSATNEELLLSSANPLKISFIPNADYRGASWFLENNLVFEAEDFCDKNGVLSDQASIILDDFSNQNNKYIGVIRLVSKTDQQRKNIFSQIKLKYNDQISCEEIDGKKPFAWTTEKNKAADWYKAQGLFNAEGVKTIYFINQTATRSVEIGCHDRIYFWYDFRKDSNHSTMKQAMFRVCHYHKPGNQENLIRVFAHKETFELEAGVKSIDEVRRNHSARIKTKQNKDREYYYDLMDIQELDKIRQSLDQDGNKRFAAYSSTTKSLDRDLYGEVLNNSGGGDYSIVVLNGLSEEHKLSKKHVDSFNEFKVKFLNTDKIAIKSWRAADSKKTHEVVKSMYCDKATSSLKEASS